MRDFVRLLVGLVVLLTFMYGSRGLNEPDEGRYTEIPLQMLQANTTWWEPNMSGFGHYDKPPLIYWVTALSLKIFGRNEYAARLPSILGALLTLIGVAWAAWRLYGARVAWWAMLICGTLAQFWLLARFLTPDMFMTGWTTLGIAAWAETRHRHGHWGFWCLSLLCWSLAWWVKATAALVPFLGLMVATLALRDARGRKALRAWLMFPTILALGSPWYLRMMSEHPELKHFFFGRELAGRVVGHEEGRKGPFYYHSLLTLIAWLPWLPVIGVTCLCKRRALPKLDWQSLVRVLGIEGWIVATGLLIFSSISSKLPTYILPLCPWAAVLLARVLLALEAGMLPRAFRRWVTATTAGLVVALLGVIVFYPRFETVIGRNCSMRPIANELRRRGAQLVFTDFYWPGMEFYFGENVRYVVHKPPQQRGDDRGVCPAIGEPHFVLPQEWKRILERNQTVGVWLLHYRKPDNGAFLEFPGDNGAGQERVLMGDFVLVKLR